jgi:hypothetical protein
MIPEWFPWIFIGGVLFIILSFLGTKYNDKEYKKIQLFQDFISGSILIGFVGVLVPDIFPVITIPFPTLSDEISDDLDLQVGPPRLIGK